MGNEKKRLTCLLTIASNGEKLKPFVIFQGKKESNINNELNKFTRDNNINIITRTQIHAWIDEELFIYYINTILTKYEPNKKKLLILDQCPAHKTPEVLNKLKNKNIDFIFIPKRMTSVLQPLDRMINFPFKKYLKNKFTDFLLFDQNEKENKSESRKRILRDIDDIWNNSKNEYEYINKETVIKSFKITGISNELDGSEDEYFDGYNIINNLTEYNEDKNSDDSSYNTDKEESFKDSKNSNKIKNNNVIPNANLDNNENIIINSDLINKEKDKEIEPNIKDLIKNLEIEEDLTSIFEQFELDSEKEQN